MNRDLLANGWRPVLLALCLTGAGMLMVGAAADADAATAFEVLVTSAGDGGQAQCPDDELCTLRAAIELVNADDTEGVESYRIAFDTAVFAPSDPTVIAVAGEALPAITRDDVTVDGADAGVVVSGSGIESDDPVDGVVVDGDGATILGLFASGFTGSCVLVDGEGARVGGNDAGDGNQVRSCGTAIAVVGDTAEVSGNVIGGCATGIDVTGGAALVEANQVDDCETGIAVDGAGVAIVGNDVGLAPDLEPVMETGIVVEGGDAFVGHESDEEGGNAIGFATVGVRVGGGDAAATATIVKNRIGQERDGSAAPVGTGVALAAPASGVEVEGNAIAHATTGIAVVFPVSAPPTGNTLRHNRFSAIGEMAIDFGPSGARTPNDSDDSDKGPNGLQNHPEFTRAVQASIIGSVPGPCGQCTVDLYLASAPGDGEPAQPIEPVEGASVSSGLSGTFVVSNPPLAPGEWVMAIATDNNGNTSEFSEAVRVGTGVIQCGNDTLAPGWNAIGYWGTATNLGAVYPPGSAAPGPVASIHERTPAGPGAFRSWYAGGDNANDLTALQSGEAYWFWSSEEVALPGAITLTGPVPSVDLEPGWNDFVYMGPEVDVEIALGELGGQFDALFRYVNDGGGERWEHYGTPEMPAWARTFETMEPCGVYQILVDEAVTFRPPAP